MQVIYYCSWVVLLCSVVFFIILKIQDAQKTPQSELEKIDRGEKDQISFSMYQADSSFAMQEAALVWSRYTGFIIINGFLVTAIIEVCLSGNLVPNDEKNSYILKAYLAVGAIGLLINTAWHIINYSGWCNQYLWFHYATTHIPESRVSTLIRFFIKKKNLKKFGRIYQLAQLLPMLFFLGCGASFYKGLTLMCPTQPCQAIEPYFITISIMLSCIIVALAIERIELASIGVKENSRDVV